MQPATHDQRMNTFFNPHGIAVFGVSPAPTNVARTILQNLLENGYQGTIVGIGSKKAAWSGVSIYPSLDEVTAPLDLAVIVTPAPSVIPMLTECRQKGIRHAVIMTAGFVELKGSEDPLSQELLRAAADLGIRFIGPNCQGVINTTQGLCLPFWHMPPDKLKRGDISVLSQSGTIAGLTSFYCSHEAGGVSKVVSMGNKMNVDEVDLLEYLFQDDTTRIIILHLESTPRGRELFELLARTPKPVILYKTQISAESAEVAFSHTAALADNDAIVEGAARQCGVLRAKTFREVIEMAKALALEPLRGNRLGIIAASGGVGIAAADTCSKAGMDLANLPHDVLSAISAIPKAKIINLTNPVDTGNIYDSRGNAKALRMILDLNSVDGAVISQFHPGTGDYFAQIPLTQVVAETEALSRDVKKPVAMHFLCDPQTREELKTKTSFPIFDTVEDAVTAMSYARQQSAAESRRLRWHEPHTTERLEPFQFDPDQHPDVQGFELLSRYTIACEKPLPAATYEEVIERADTIGYPVVLKALSFDFTHKRSQGAVALNLIDQESLLSAFRAMGKTLTAGKARIATFLVQRMAPPGPELIFGGRRDPHYGPVVLVGRGGTAVEEIDASLCYMAPVSYGMAEDMLGALKEIDGIDVCNQLLRDALCRFSQLLVDNPALLEIDCNPVRISDSKPVDYTVLDVRIKLHR